MMTTIKTPSIAKKTRTSKAKVSVSSVTNVKTPAKQALQNHLVYSIFKTDEVATPRDWYSTTAYTVRDHVIDRWVKTVEAYGEQDPKRVYYLSLEFLIGRMLSNATLNLGVAPQVRDGLNDLGHKMENVVEMEPDASARQRRFRAFSGLFSRLDGDNGYPWYRLWHSL
jgi:starch phosphorylase